MRQDRRSHRQVTTALSEPVYLRLITAKLYTGKPLKALVAEGCALVALHYQQLIGQEMITDTPPELGAAREHLPAFRKVTTELDAEAYLRLFTASVYAGRSLKSLAADGCRQIGDHYWTLRQEERRNAL